MKDHPPREMDGVGEGGDDIRHLFSYNLQRLAGLSSRIASLSMRADYDLTTIEWRALAVLDFLVQAPLHLLAQRAGLQKSQMSRLVADLEQAGLVRRVSHPSDKRSILLMLSPEGKALVARVLASSRERNDRMLSLLDPQERRMLMQLIGKVTVGSVAYLRQLKSDDRDGAPNDPEPPSLFEE